MDAHSAVGSNALAVRQKQAASGDRDMPVGTDIRLQVGNLPGCARINTAHNVELDGAISVDTGNIDDPDATRNCASAGP